MTQFRQSNRRRRSDKFVNTSSQLRRLHYKRRGKLQGVIDLKLVSLPLSR